MINPFKEINWNPGDEEIRTFGRSMLVGFLVIALIVLVASIATKPFDEALAAPIAVSLTGFFLHVLSRLGVTICKPFYLVWHFLAASIGIVVANLLLLFYYYLLLSPFAVLFRITTGRDPLKLKRDVNRRSEWEKVERRRGLKSYFKLY